MGTTQYAGQTVDVDDDGFMTNTDQWNRDVAEAIAAEFDITPLTEDHWKVIEFCRTDTTEKGEPPGLRRISKRSGVNMKQLYKLFPKGPGKLASKISGLPKPKSCI